MQEMLLSYSWTIILRKVNEKILHTYFNISRVENAINNVSLLDNVDHATA